MQSEDLLIRQLTKINIDRETDNNIHKILSNRINWNSFLLRAKGEKVSSLIYKRLSEIDYAKSFVPENVWNRLEGHYSATAARNILLSKRLADILESFSQAGVEVILLKGMALVHSIYHNIALRPIYDIDFLIHKDDFPMIEDRLRKLGFRNYRFHLEYFLKDNLGVDIHWDLININRVRSRKNSYNIDINELWQDSMPIEIDGQRTRVLSHEHCLIALCLHLFLHHGLSGLIWFNDIARFIDYYKNQIDWNKFMDKTLGYKVHKPVYYTLYYVKENLGQDMPQFVLDGLQPKRQGLFERKIFDLILDGEELDNIRFFFTLITIEGFFARLNFLREIILPTPRVLQARYNISSSRYLPRYYIIHLKNIFSSLLKLLKKILPTFV